MSDDRVFMMGEFEAVFPADRHYAKNHMWAQPAEDPNCWRFGFSAYAVRLLQDVYFLDWDHEAPASVQQGQQIGSIESKKAESELYAPIEGDLMKFNQQLMEDPSAINVDKYGGGWLFEILGPGDPLLSADQYLKHLESVWEITQRTIKGQLS
jgi:glycine cleavage system H protein